MIWKADNFEGESFCLSRVQHSFRERSSFSPTPQILQWWPQEWKRDGVINLQFRVHLIIPWASNFNVFFFFYQHFDIIWLSFVSQTGQVPSGWPKTEASGFWLTGFSEQLRRRSSVVYLQGQPCHRTFAWKKMSALRKQIPSHENSEL